MLGLGSSLYKAGKVGKSIIRDGLVLRHDYNAGAVEPVSSGAASFDGTDDYIGLGASNSLVTGNNVTLACWFRVLDTDSSYLFQNQKGSGASNIFLRVNTDGTGAGVIGAGVWNGSSHSIIDFDGDVDTTDSWHHIAYTTTSSAQVLYLDGIAVDDGTGTFANAASSDQSVIGSLNAASSFFKGYMCNVGVWSAALTQPQIKSIMHKDYAALSASEKTSLVSWWNLDSTADTSTDENGSNLTNAVLDEKGVIGSEVVINGDFSTSGVVTDTSFSLGWATASGDDANDANIADGLLTLNTLNDTPNDTTARAYLTNGNNISALNIDQIYKLTFDVVAVSDNDPAFTIYHMAGAYQAVPSAVGSYSYYIRNTSNPLFLFRLNTDNSHISISNVSIKPLSGNHGTLA